MSSSKRPLLFLLIVVAVVGVLWWSLRSGPEESEDAPVAAADVRGGSNEGATTPSQPGKRKGTLALLEAPKASISGTVSTKGAGPLGGAQVCAFMQDDWLGAPRETPCVKTAADGRYRIEGLVASTYDVTASAPQHIVGRHLAKGRHNPGVRVAAGQQRADVDIVLGPGGVEVSGIVRDIAGGEIAGAQVRLGNPQSAPALALADAEGKFQLWVPEGSTLLRATAEGYADEQQWGRVPGTSFALYLTPEAVVVGRVVDVATGEPVGGAQVTATGARTVLSDAEGRFRMDGLMPGVYKPIAKADEGYGEAAASVHLGLGETSGEVVVPLHRAATVSGMVLVRDGEKTQPCEEGGAFLTPIPEVASSRNRAATEAGRVQIRGVLPGRYQVFAHCQGYVHEENYGELEVGDRSIEGLVWEVKKGSTIRGRVLAEPEVLASVRVDGNSMDVLSGRLFFASSREVGDDGSFALTGLAPGTYSLTLQGGDLPRRGASVDVEVAEGEDVEGVELEAPAVAIIRGRVEDATGKPIAGVEVRASGAARDMAIGFVDDDGRFELRGLKGGEYRVEASLGWNGGLRKPGTTDDDPQGEVVTVEAGGSAEVALVVEARDASISGVVVDGSGGPISDAYVRAERISDSMAANPQRGVPQARWGSWNAKPLMTDADGAFTLSGLSEGTYVVWAIRKGGGEGFVENVAAGSEGVSVELQTTGRIEGRVVAHSGAAPQRFTVAVRDDARGFARTDSFFATEGRFVMDELPPGAFIVSASSPEGSGDTKVTLEEGAEQTGVDVKLQKMVAVRGKVIDLDTGDPVSGISVSMDRKNAAARAGLGIMGDQKNVTGEDGTYVLEGVAVGPVSVTLFPKDLFAGGSTYGIMMLDLVVEDRSPFEAPDLEVIVNRMKPDELPGDLGYTLKEADPTANASDLPLVIGVVRPGGPAERSGLKVGATIVAVDGHDVRGDKAPRYGPLTQVGAGAKVELGLEGGETVTITAAKLQ